MTHIIHGEPEASEALRVRIHLQPGWRAGVHEHLDENSLGDPDEFR
jgi:metallo-beta-lactamase family protein